ncbi:MAG TPA: DUF3570 domain-containing protein [Telluria sp.]|nr:DUF3570 domain-containing protein [Telluria sp.]
MAAIKAPAGGSILMAALALPGVAHAETPPESASLSFKYLDYADWQASLDRIRVKSPALELVLPVAGEWSLRAGYVGDAISGASPRYHTAVSGASRFEEKRRAADLAVTRYFQRSSVTVAAGRSSETDYLSRFASVRGTLSSDDNNTTWTFGAGVANDRIDPVNDAVEGERKHTSDFMAGVTRVMTPRDLVQAVLSYARGRGYFSMPYKYLDNRPRRHDQNSLLLRWNHRLAKGEATSRSSYRYFSDTYGIRAHTLQQEYARELPGGWTLTPSLRLHTQSAANFYFDPVYDPVFGPPFPPGFDFAQQRDLSADQRLSAFGAVTLGLKVEKQVGANSSVELKLERYRQRGAWRLFGSGSPGLEDFEARSVVVGWNFRW